MLFWGGGGMTARILTGDCLQIMPDEGPFSLIVADPPYGDTSLAWDRRIEGWWRIAHDCLHPFGSMWVFGSMRFFMEQADLIRDARFRYAQDIVWEKHNGSGFHADRFKRVHEHVVHLYRDDAAWSSVYNEVQTTKDAKARRVPRRGTTPHTGSIGTDKPYVTQDGDPRVMRSVVAIPSCHGHAIHPTEKPVDLLQILVRTSCPAGGLVGDFFAGSGSCAEACVVTGRDYIGCEIDPVMAERARNRSLFVREAA